MALIIQTNSHQVSVSSLVCNPLTQALKIPEDVFRLFAQALHEDNEDTIHPRKNLSVFSRVTRMTRRASFDLLYSCVSAGPTWQGALEVIQALCQARDHSTLLEYPPSPQPYSTWVKALVIHVHAEGEEAHDWETLLSRRHGSPRPDRHEVARAARTMVQTTRALFVALNPHNFPKLKKLVLAFTVGTTPESVAKTVAIFMREITVQLDAITMIGLDPATWDSAATFESLCRSFKHHKHLRWLSFHCDVEWVRWDLPLFFLPGHISSGFHLATCESILPKLLSNLTDIQARLTSLSINCAAHPETSDTYCLREIQQRLTWGNLLQLDLSQFFLEGGWIVSLLSRCPLLQEYQVSMRRPDEPRDLTDSLKDWSDRLARHELREWSIHGRRTSERFDDSSFDEDLYLALVGSDNDSASASDGDSDSPSNNASDSNGDNDSLQFPRKPHFKFLQQVLTTLQRIEKVSLAPDEEFGGETVFFKCSHCGRFCNDTNKLVYNRKGKEHRHGCHGGA